VYLLNKYLKCSVWTLALRHDIYIYIYIYVVRLQKVKVRKLGWKIDITHLSYVLA